MAWLRSLRRRCCILIFDRFFPTSETDPNKDIKSGNLPAGTVIDREITSPIEYDFYLQSHAGLLGTSRSSHYTVGHGTNLLWHDADCNLTARLSVTRMHSSMCHLFIVSSYTYGFCSPNQLQMMAYTLCHVYARSTRAVSIPAPVYCRLTVVSRNVLAHPRRCPHCV